MGELRKRVRASIWKLVAGFAFGCAVTLPVFALSLSTELSRILVLGLVFFGIGCGALATAFLFNRRVLSPLLDFSERVEELHQEISDSYLFQWQSGRTLEAYLSSTFEFFASEVQYEQSNELKQSLALYASRDAIFEWYPDLHEFRISGNVAAVFDAGPVGLAGRSLEAWWIQQFSAAEWTRLNSDIAQLYSGTADRIEAVYQIQSRTSTQRWIRLTATRARDRVVHIVGIVSDVSSEQSEKGRIERLAFTSQMAGYPNYRAFEMDFAQARNENPAESLCLLIVDIDDFARILNSLGPDLGDKLVSEVGSVLELWFTELLPHGTWTLYHHYYDEFLVSIPGFSSEDEAAQFVESLHASFEDGIRLDIQQSFFVTVSVGFSFAEETGSSDALHWVKQAYIALRQAKTRGKNAVVQYREDFSRRHSHTFEKVNHLWTMLHEKKLSVHYQPIVAAGSSAIQGFEALLRLPFIDPVSDSVQDYIVIAEESGVIRHLGKWILQQVLAQIQAWQQTGMPFSFVSINLSPVELSQPNIIQHFREQLDSFGLAPSILQVEITETAVLNPTARVVETLNGFRQLGIRVALDDFGAGFSSMEHLNSLPIDTVKLDKTITQIEETESRSLAILHAIVRLSQRIGISIIAEGVETVRQKELLEGLGCNLIQGFLFSPALPAHQVPGMYPGPFETQKLVEELNFP